MLKSNGVSVLFENDNIDSECMNSEMILYIKSAFAQQEAMSASKRMQISVRMRMEDGTYVSSSVPYGYRLVDKELQIVPEEAEVVREIFRLYLSGKGTSAIRKYLNDEGKGAWGENSVRYILTNERYIGECLLQKNYTLEILPLRSQINRGELPKFFYTNSHEPIITKQDFEAAQTLRKEREINYHNTRSEKKEFFSGKIYCQQCNWVYKRQKNIEGKYWICSGKGRGLQKCNAPRFSEQELRHAFVKMFNTLKTNSKVLLDETIAQLQALKLKVNRGNDEIREIDREIASLSEQNNTYSILFSQGVIDNVTYYEQTDKLKRNLYEQRVRRQKLIDENEDEKCIEKLRELRKLIQVSEYLTEMNEPLFDEIVEKILVEQDGTLSFRLKCELELKVKADK